MVKQSALGKGTAVNASGTGLGNTGAGPELPGPRPVFHGTDPGSPRPDPEVPGAGFGAIGLHAILPYPTVGLDCASKAS